MGSKNPLFPFSAVLRRSSLIFGATPDPDGPTRKTYGFKNGMGAARLECKSLLTSVNLQKQYNALNILPDI